MADRGFFDQNNRVSLFAVSNSDGSTPVSLWADPITHALVVSASVTISGVATATNQTNGSQKTQIVDGSGNVIASSGNALNVNVTSATVSGSKTNNNAAPGATNVGALVGIANAAAPTYSEGNEVLLSTDLAGALRVTGSLSVGGTTDNAAYTAGSSTGTPAMGFYHSTIDTVTDGRAATIGMTSKRAMLVNLQNASGTEIGTATTPVVSEISDGTNVANVVAGDTGFNGVTVTAGVKTIAFTTSVAGAQTLLANTDLRGYSYLEVSYSSVGTGLALTGQFATTSGGNYITPTSTWTTSTSTGPAALGVAVNTTYSTPIRGNFFQLVLSALTSGTVTGTLTLRAFPPTPAVQFVAGSGNFQTVGTKSSNAAIPSTNNLGVLPAVANAAAPTYTETFQTLLSTDLKGNTRIRISDAAGNDRGANVNSSNQLSVSIDNSPVLGAGTAVIGHVIVDSGAITATLNAETTKVIGTVNVAASQTIAVTNAGTFAVQADNTKIGGNAISAGNGASGTGVQRVTIASDSTGQVAPAANATATGTSIYNNTALSSTKQVVNASAGNLYGYHMYNPNSVVIYIQLFNLASASVTVGSTTPTAVLAVPALGWVDSDLPVPVNFGTALTIAATTTAAGSTAPTTALLCNIWFK